MIIDVLLIALLCVYVIDLSGFVTELETILAKWLGVRKVEIPKPISCSLCMTWWVGLLYLFITAQFTLEGVGVVAACSFLTTTLYSGLWAVKDLLDNVVGWLAKNINKIK